MYCVKCGVKLSESVASCPLCNTPVWKPDGELAPNAYASGNPASYKNSRRPLAAVFTALFALIEIVVMVVCLNMYGKLYWGGFVMLGLATLYCILFLPMWFEGLTPIVFLCIDFAAIEGVALFISVYLKGGWFLSFAFPVIGIAGLLLIALVSCIKYIKQGKLYMFGAYFILMGGYSMLVEFFQCLTFNSKMFTWSLYSASTCAVFGLFLIIAGAVTPLKEYLRKKFFI